MRDDYMVFLLPCDFMKSIFSRVALLAMLLVLFGCAAPKDLVSHVGGDALRQFSSTAKELSAEPDMVSVPVDLWPKALRGAKVEGVSYYIDGVMIKISSGSKTSKGVFVGWTDEVPYDGSGITFEYIEPRVYSYVEKMR